VHQVAERAGVSRRAVYLHFDSLEALFATAVARRATELCADWQAPPPDTPLADRIDWFTQHWTALAEALRPLRRAAAVYEPFSPEVQETFDRARQWARSAVEVVFLPELSARTAHERVPLTTALHHVTSWSGWDELQRPGSDTSEASAAVRLLLHALLAPTTPVTHFCPH
jgi:AcrR family transcriptional regulator